MKSWEVIISDSEANTTVILLIKLIRMHPIADPFEPHAGPNAAYLNTFTTSANKHHGSRNINKCVQKANRETSYNRNIHSTQDSI
jgi:hypothetical protein